MGNKGAKLHPSTARAKRTYSTFIQHIQTINEITG